MDGFVLLRCVGRSTDGEYAVLQTKHQGGAYSVSANGIESVSFSFYKNVSGGVYETITEEDYTNANFSYMSSLNALSQRIEEVYNKVDFGRNKMASLGDSITYGFIPRNADGYPGQLDSFAKIAADYFGMEFENHGIAGSTVAIVDGAEPMCERVDLLPEDADVVTFRGGTNDIRKGVSLGTMTDRDGSTFYGALHVVMSALYKKYMVDKEFEAAKKTRVVICTPIKLLDNYYANRQGDGILVNLVPWVNAIKEVANYYSLPVLDFYNLSMINPHLNRTVKGTEEGYTGYYNPHITDGTHPTQEGAQLMANALISFLKNI
jgi:lysophospholipase L1-like esterase